MKRPEVYFRWVAQLWRSLWVKRPAVAPSTLTALEPTPPPTPSSEKKSQKELKWAREAQWVFRRDVLDRLDDYFSCMRRMRARNKSDYELFSRVGFVLSSDAYCFSDKAKFPERPAFGGIMLPSTSDDKKIVPAFVYFQKMKRPLRVVTIPGTTTYRVSVVYDERHGGRRIWAIGEYHVAVTNSGAVKLLREGLYVQQSVGNRDRGSVFHLRWQAPPWLQSMADEKIADQKETTAEQIATELFLLALGTHRHALRGLVVRAIANDGTAAAFGIDIKRAPYFFRDRDLTAAATVNGKRRPIFHHVSEHERKKGNSVTTVKAHYRGLRQFLWGRVAVSIAWPDAKLFLTGDGPAAYDADALINEDLGCMVDADRAAAGIVALMDSKPNDRVLH